MTKASCCSAFMSFAVVPLTRGAPKSFALCDTKLTPVPAAARNNRQYAWLQPIGLQLAGGTGCGEFKERCNNYTFTCELADRSISCSLAKQVCKLLPSVPKVPGKMQLNAPNYQLPSFRSQSCHIVSCGLPARNICCDLTPTCYNWFQSSCSWSFEIVQVRYIAHGLILLFNKQLQDLQ